MYDDSVLLHHRSQVQAAVGVCRECCCRYQFIETMEIKNQDRSKGGKHYIITLCYGTASVDWQWPEASVIPSRYLHLDLSDCLYCFYHWIYLFLYLLSDFNNYRSIHRTILTIFHRSIDLLQRCMSSCVCVHGLLHYSHQLGQSCK